jgi:hypothetical protein
VPDLRHHDWGSDPLFDSAIVGHGFAPYMRDYDVIVEVPAAKPDGTGSYIRARYRYRFTHCVVVTTETGVRPETWTESWGDEFKSYAAWEAAGTPSGFVWGVEWADAYPGASTVIDSPRAAEWSDRLGRAMHEVEIKTNAYTLRLICHALQIEQLAVGDPTTGDLKGLDAT